MPQPLSYRLPLSYILRFVGAVALGRRREVGEDAQAVLARTRFPYRVLQQERIPETGPLAIIANHYERPGLKVFWGGMVLTAALWERRHQSPRWLMTSEWYNFRLGPLPVPVPVLRWLFRRLADVYGLIIVPRAKERAMGRAAVVRAVLEAAQGDRPIAFFPEGIGTGTLIRPPEAVGLLLLGLAQKGVPVVPAGLYEEEGVLVAKFGPPVPFQMGDGDEREQARQARDQAMMAIGRLLPPPMWGYYALDLQRAMERGEHTV